MLYMNGNICLFLVIIPHTRFIKTRRWHIEIKSPIEELVSKVLSELERLNYAYSTFCGYRAFYKRVIAFSKEKEEIYFTETLGRELLREKYNCTINYYREVMTKELSGPIRRIRVLGEYQLHVDMIRRIVNKKGT